MTAVTRRKVGIVSIVVLALVASLLVWIATKSEGEVVRKAELNDGGVWVSSSEYGRWARLNSAARQLDAGVASSTVGTTSGLDVLQSGSAVLGYSKTANEVVPIDPVQATAGQSDAIILPKDSGATGNKVYAALPIDLRGGTVAMVEPTTGKVRAQRVNEVEGITNLGNLQTQAKPLATVGENAAVAVGVDGTIYALSSAKGTLAIIKQEGAGFAKPTFVDLKFNAKSAQVTAVGSTWAVYEPTSDVLYSPNLKKPEKVSLGASTEPGLPTYAALQQPGPASNFVVIQDSESATEVPLNDTDVKPRSIKQQHSKPEGLILTAPVRVGNCFHAGWAGPTVAIYGRNCGQDLQSGTVALTEIGKGVRTDGLRLRVNRDVVVLNDLDTGAVWDIQNQNMKIDNWDSIIPPPVSKDQNPNKDPDTNDLVVKQPPKAQPDTMKVRPGRTSALHVLDNDTDASGAILSIAPDGVTKPDAADISAIPSADGQTIQVDVPEEPSADTFTFTYTVNNGGSGKDNTSSAKVTVNVIRDPNQNTAPKLRSGQANLAKGSFHVVHDTNVKVGVLADWRDDENDPMQIEPADVSVGVDSAGAMTIPAGSKKGDQPMKYAVSDGLGGKAEGTVVLKVLGDDDKPVAPRTQPDVIRAVAGKPVQLQPLGNDIAGADPTDPEAVTKLAAEVKSNNNLTVDTNLDTGVLTITGRVPNTSQTITYAAQTGTTATVGRIRVDILPPVGDDLPPVATPDAGVLRNQSPIIADVLSNDFSPRSDVLVVQKVTSSEPWLRASVVQGRWIRVEATQPYSGRDLKGLLKYTISDGKQTAVGELNIIQKPEADPKPRPTVVDDSAVVRIGDAVTIPVLDNDSMTDGIELKLDPARVKVISGKGEAFASGSVVRFVPEMQGAAMKGPESAVIEYTVFPAGSPAQARTGRATVTVQPQPGKTNPNQAPTARSFSASVTAGDTIAITVPTSGVDPDGDLTFVSGIVGEDGAAVDLKHGRVLAFGAATIRYQAFPRSSGTEVIRYQLRDRYGLSSEGFIRVGVVQPGDPQPPVAVQDDVVAAPGRTVHVDLLANDLISAGDYVEYEPFEEQNEPAVLKDFIRQKDNSFKVVVPEEGKAKVLRYAIGNGLFDPSSSTLTVRGRKDFNNPPIAIDDVGQAKPGETSIVVDALANDRDIDSERSTLKIQKVIGDGATIENNKVKIQLQPQSRVLPYVIEDADGAVAMALIYVPAGSQGLPYVVSGKTIKMQPDSSTSINLGDYVVDPRGGTIKLTSPETLSTAPVENLQVEDKSATELNLSSTNGYVGPAALMLEVTNKKDDQDKDAQTTYVTIPVQVGPDVPVLRCPTFEVTVTAGGAARTADIPRLCHAWFPDGMDENKASYEATWSPAINDVTMKQEGQGGRVVRIQAGQDAPGGASGTIVVKAKGSTETFKLGVKVIGTKKAAVVDDPPPVPPATVRPMRIEGLIAGKSETINVAQFMDSSLPNKQCTIVSSRVVSGTGLSATQSGCNLTVSASDKARNAGAIQVRVTDGKDRPAALGQVSVTVRGKPDPMPAPNAVPDRVAGGQARVSYTPPAYDGGLPILEYEVKSSAGQSVRGCASPCTVTGLTNGKDYTFQVRARNAVDWSEWSPASNVARPDTKPQATMISNIVPGDRQVTVNWSPPKNDGSPVKTYLLTWTNVGANAGQTGTATIPAGSTSRVVTGLINNDAYTFRVKAANELGYGPNGPEVKSQSFGTPQNVPAPNLAPRQPVEGEPNAQVRVTWPSVDPNGPPITKYDVYRRSNGGAWQHIATKSPDQRFAVDTVPYAGQNLQYSVTATNGGPKTSTQANFSSYVANGYPDVPRLISATTPRDDKKIVVRFSTGNPRSAGFDYIHWTTAGVTGQWDCPGGTCPTSGTTRALEPVSRTIQLRACNSAGYCSSLSNEIRVHPYGPTLGVGGISSTSADHSVTFKWSKPTNNGNPIGGYRVSHTGGGSGCSGTLGPNNTSCTVSGLGFSTTVKVSVTPFADRSGDGPTASGSATTNKEPPQVLRVFKNQQCPATGSCWDPYQQAWCGTNCYHVGYELKDFRGPISCAVSGWDQPDNGNNGSIEPRNGSNNSNKFYGYNGHGITVTCTASNGSDSGYTDWN